MSIKEWFKKWFKPVPPSLEAPAPVVEDSDWDGKELASADSTGKLKLGVVIGHTKVKPGAKLAGSGGQHEYHYNKVVAQQMIDYAKKAHPMVSIEVFFRDEGGIAGAYGGAIKAMCDAVIELHFNAFNGTVKGTSTLTTADYSDGQFAHYIHKAMCKLFGRDGASRGVKSISRSDRGGVNVHSFPAGVNCLVEPFFGDNDEEAKMGIRLSQPYAQCLVDAVVLWGKQVDLLK